MAAFSGFAGECGENETDDSSPVVLFELGAYPAWWSRLVSHPADSISSVRLPPPPYVHSMSTESFLVPPQAPLPAYARVVPPAPTPAPAPAPILAPAPATGHVTPRDAVAFAAASAASVAGSAATTSSQPSRRLTRMASR